MFISTNIKLSNCWTETRLKSYSKYTCVHVYLEYVCMCNLWLQDMVAQEDSEQFVC